MQKSDEDTGGRRAISVIPLIVEWEKFVSDHDAPTLIGFAIWLLDREGRNGPTDELQEYFDGNNAEYGYSFLTAETAFLLWRLNKFARHYSKPVFVAAGLGGSDEFAILSHVDYKKECTKKVAIGGNLLELTTGTDIIKRLIAKKLLREKSNPEDRREKLLSVTAKGEAVLQRVYAGFASMQDLLADLGGKERRALVNVLKSLDDYHTKFVSESAKK